MKQLQLRDGDFVLGQGGLGTVEGAQRLRQDLGCAVREEIGTDRFHPKWGSILNDYIGREQDIDTTTLVKGEIARVIQNYIVVQSDQMTKDADAGRRARFRADDVIAGVSSIQIQQRTDQMSVRAIVVTSSGEPVVVVKTLGAAE